MRILWLITVLALATGLAVLHTWALTDYLYWYYLWLDVPMHLLGGLTLGMFLISLSRTWRPLLYVLGIAFMLLGWEVFEVLLGVGREAKNYFFDTSLDVLMGALGAMIAYFLARFTLWRSA